MGADLDPKYIVAGEDQGWRSIFIQDEFPVRKIEITKDFEVSKYEITNLQYEQFAPEHKALRGSFKGISANDDEAAVYVSWQDASDFAQWLSKMDRKYTYRLPTEAEWEYVARAGSRTIFSDGNTQNVYENNPFSASAMKAMNYQWSYPYTWSNGCRGWTTWKTDDCVGVEDVYPDKNEVQDVDLSIGQSAPNAFGVYDVHGGVEEWVHDWYGIYDPNQTTNPSGPVTGDFKVARGGSHNDHVQHTRSANRMSAAINEQHYLIGIRLVRIPKTTKLILETSKPEIRPWNDHVTQVDHQWGQDTDKPTFEMTSLYELVPKLDDGSHYGSIEQLKQFGFDPITKSASLTGPLYTHNHSPTIAWCKNGDILVSWFTGESEVGPELTLVASRGKRQSDGTLAWTYPSEFLKAADRNMHASNIITSTINGPGILHQMASIGASGRWDKMALGYRRSNDNGATWSPVKMVLELDHGYTQGVTLEANMLEASNGDLIFVADGTFDGSSTTGSLVVSSDGGETWYRRGHSSNTPTENRISGIHAAVVEINDQNNDGKNDYLAIGRDNGKYFAGKAPLSISLDGGHTWKHKPSVFPSIKSEQRFGLIRLNYSRNTRYPDVKPILHVGFANKGIMAKNAESQLEEISGLYVAVSFDNGETWPAEYRRVVSDVQGADTKEIGIAPWQKSNILSRTQGQALGYMSVIQSPDGIIYLTDGKIMYSFNLSWIISD